MTGCTVKMELTNTMMYTDRRGFSRLFTQLDMSHVWMQKRIFRFEIYIIFILHHVKKVYSC